ncbi:NitT/TauT family transport system permease protein [Sporobacter termitidis DSM 10068]|uniref:NitT/TauT family transport system permease protein n=1 Tax=Sporobacter termitidis DSM 10068 TaxID=1123282 RepID=A0A1M5XG46_9FIRM|nr:ABC transporter permease [Sporobacter termitidis]SHH98484.1 NitT/TauT family transport system permease protein [Sporobacter termitidis DSM 10068]
MKRFLIKANKRLMSFYLLIILLVIWQLAPSLGWTNPMYVPSLSTIATEAVKMTIPQVLLNVGVSLRRVLIGFLLCVAGGLPLAFLMGGAVPKVALALRSLMQFLSQIPAYILFPVITMIWGPGEKSIAIVIFWSGFWPLLFTTIQGIQDIDPKLIRCARTMNAGPLTLFVKVILPAVLPNLMRGIRLGMTNCFLILIGAETMGGESGIGWLINHSQRMGQVPLIYLGAILAAVLGFLLNLLMLKLENRIVKWKQLPEDAAA